MRNDTQRISIDFLIDQFLKTKDAEGLAPGTLRFYKFKLSNFHNYCVSITKPDIFSINEETLRDYLLQLRPTHSPGGIHAFFRAIHAFFSWFDTEFEPENWKNPMRKVKAPKVPEEILDPISMDVVSELLKTCNNDFYGLRDRAIITLLDDTGLRASELLALDLDTLDMPLSVLYVEHGKGGYPRAVDFNHATKRALRAYLKVRPRCDVNSVFVSKYKDTLSYDGLRTMLGVRAKVARVEKVMLHAFRRKHVLDLYRAGEGELTIQKRIGHRDGKTIHRYIKLSREDMRRAAKRKNNPR